MKKYGRLQIIKHSLEYYIQRPNATQDEIKEELAVLKQITNQIDQIKEQYHISTNRYRVTHDNGEIWEFECSSEKTAKRKAFKYYKEKFPFIEYNEFLSNVIAKKIL